MTREAILAFDNTNHAIRAENLLLGVKLQVRVMPLPPSIKAGCGLCLRLAENELPGALRMFDAHNVPVASIYLRSADGGGSTYTPYEV